MSTLRLGVGWAVVGAVAAACGADMVCRRWAPAAVEQPARADGVVRFDLGGIPRGAKVLRADLIIRRTAAITGRDEDALVAVEVVPMFGPPAAGGSPAPGPAAAALVLRPPWYDRLDATTAVQAWAEGKVHGGFLVKVCPRWEAGATRLDVAWEGKPEDDLPPQVRGLAVTHRAGQTFIAFQEIDGRSAEPAPLWSELRGRLERLDADKEVRYRIYRHDRPITAGTLAAAELLGEVRPMSGYNVLGRSVDQLIALHRRRAIDDLDFAKKLARNNYFEDYGPDMPEMGDLPVQRLAIEDGKPLPPRTGLYVHQAPAMQRPAPKAYYAVVTVVDGLANTRDFSPANSLAKPVEEGVGPGEPVLQRDADVTVFFDYPGRRSQYVQWAAPPLAHLPNQYFNWGVFVPDGFRSAPQRRLSVFFHDGTQRYLKPPWPHRRDTALLSPHDAPYRSYGYGYHEALGTLRSFRQGTVQPFLARRVDAMVAWALRRLGADPGRVSCGGRGHWGGTAAIQYGLRRTGRIAYVCAEESADADPNQTPYEYSMYGRGDVRKTDRPEMDAVWGRAEWSIPAESGQPIWQEMSLAAYVLAEGRKRTLPFLSLGAGSQHVTWKQETDLMKAYLATGNAFMAEFFWGSSTHRPLPVDAASGDLPFEPRTDAPILACNPKDRSPNPDFFPKQFDTGLRGYAGGSRLSTRPRWSPQDIVDAPDRLEMTIYAARQVVYAGKVTCDVVVRNARQFRPPPGRKLKWIITDAEKGKLLQEGVATVDADGLIPLPAVEFAAPARLVIRAAESKEGGQ